MFQYLDKICCDDQKFQNIIKEKEKKYLTNIEKIKQECDIRTNQSLLLLQKEKERLEQSIHTQKDISRDYWLNREDTIRKEKKKRKGKYHSRTIRLKVRKIQLNSIAKQNKDRMKHTYRISK